MEEQGKTYTKLIVTVGLGVEEKKFCAKLPTSAFAQNVQFPNFLCAVATENRTIAQVCATFVTPDGTYKIFK